MSTVKSSADHLTLNADGAAKDIKFQANGVEKASISSTGAFTSTSIDATKLSGNLPAIDGSGLTGDIGIGNGQTWQDVTALRANNVVYTNSTGKSIMVVVEGVGLAPGDYFACYAGSHRLSYTTSADSDGFSFIIPDGITYKAQFSNCNIRSWSELR